MSRNLRDRLLPQKQQENSESRVLLAVYGAMRKGAFNNSLLEGEEYLGIGQIAGAALYMDGQMPVVKEAGSGTSVVADVYLIPESKLALADMVEGFSQTSPDSSVFTRRLTNVYVPGLSEKHSPLVKESGYSLAWVYFYSFQVGHGTERIRGGDYLRYMRDTGRLPLTEEDLEAIRRERPFLPTYVSEEDQDPEREADF